ncbi:hypothetical protein R3P38DRAFT_3248977 [Favolaschia claudopus]|uniref:Uncharacterized protein n=1 Tax=Favolaschia claudopus TaxID=2862362 RepID=A0AAV9YXW4_9AGAR
MAPPPPLLIPTRSARFYENIPGYLVFLVETTLFRVEPNTIYRSSEVLRDIAESPGPDGSRQVPSDANPIPLPPQVGAMAFEVFLRVVHAELKESLAQHRAILAAEEPLFAKETKDETGGKNIKVGPCHHPGCKDHQSCEEDWHCVWWNGIGRSLLDGRNPLSWTESVKKLEAMHFGRMHLGCRQIILEYIDEDQLNGHGRVYDMIDAVSGMLLADIVEDN